MEIHFRIWTLRPASERITEAEGKMHVFNWQLVYFIPDAKRQIATWMSMHQNVIKSKSSILTFSTAGACTKLFSGCFWLFVEKIGGNSSESQARQHTHSFLPSYLFFKILWSIKFEFVMKEPQKHPENIGDPTQQKKRNLFFYHSFTNSKCSATLQFN